MKKTTLLDVLQAGFKLDGFINTVNFFADTLIYDDPGVLKERDAIIRSVKEKWKEIGRQICSDHGVAFGSGLPDSSYNQVISEAAEAKFKAFLDFMSGNPANIFSSKKECGP